MCEVIRHSPLFLFTDRLVCCAVLQTKKAVKIDRRGPDGRDHARKSINDELVAVINDGLYFYEQELRHHTRRPARDNRHAAAPKVTVGQDPTRKIRSCRPDDLGCWVFFQSRHRSRQACWPHYQA